MPPRSAVDFARRDADFMQVLYPDAVCCSVYDYPLATMHSPLHEVVAWGWDAVVRHEARRFTDKVCGALGDESPLERGG